MVIDDIWIKNSFVDEIEHLKPVEAKEKIIGIYKGRAIYVFAELDDVFEEKRGQVLLANKALGSLVDLLML